MAKLSEVEAPFFTVDDRSTDPSTPAAGLGLVYMKDGVWHSIDDAGAVTEYGAGSTLFGNFTPSWTNVTVGSGTNTGRVWQLGSGTGSLVVVSANLVFAADTSITGAVSLTLPVNAAYTNNIPRGIAQFTDAGTANFDGRVQITATTTAQPAAIVTSASHASFAGITSTVPFTWTTNDRLHMWLSYEAA